MVRTSIADIDGRVLFTKDQYDILRVDLDGITYYSEQELEFVDSEPSQQHFGALQETRKLLEVESVDSLSDQLIEDLEEVFKDAGATVKSGSGKRSS